MYLQNLLVVDYLQNKMDKHTRFLLKPSRRNTINDNDVLSYTLTAMMFCLTKEWNDFPAYSVNLFIKAYRITCKENFKIHLKALCPWDDMISLWLWLWCAFYNRPLVKHIIPLSKCISRLDDTHKNVHMKVVSKKWQLLRYRVTISRMLKDFKE